MTRKTTSHLSEGLFLRRSGTSSGGWPRWPRAALSVLAVLLLAGVAAASPRGEPCGAGVPILETAILGPTGLGPEGATIDDDQYLGVKFEVETPSRVVRLGGHLVSWIPEGPIFVAIAPLDPVTDLPSDLELSGAVFATTFQPPASSQEVTLCSDVVLEPGRYGLIFGTSLFGATGAAIAPLTDELIGNPEVFRAVPKSDQWVDLADMSLPTRFFVFAETDSVTTGGLPHFALGDATIDALSATELRVSNLGSSGLDGVSIGVGEARAWGGRISDVSEAGRFSASAIAQVDGMPNQAVALMDLQEDSQGELTVNANFAGNAGQPIAVEVSSGGETVGLQAIAQEDPFSVRCILDGTPISCWVAAMFIDFNALPLFCDWSLGLTSLGFGSLGFGAQEVAVEVEVGGQIYTGDRVSVRTIPGPEPGPAVDFVSRIDLFSSDTGSFVLGDESLLASGLFSDGFESGDTSAWQATVP